MNKHTSVFSMVVWNLIFNIMHWTRYWCILPEKQLLTMKAMWCTEIEEGTKG